MREMNTGKVVEGVMSMYRVSDAAKTFTRILRMVAGAGGGGAAVGMVVEAVAVVGEGVIS